MLITSRTASAPGRAALSAGVRSVAASVGLHLSRRWRVFHNPRTNQPWETDGQIRKAAWAPALERAGVVYRNPYQTRHTYASTLLSAGENSLWVAQQMGHKDQGMIRRRYGRWIPEVDASADGKVMQFWAQFGHKAGVSA